MKSLSLSSLPISILLLSLIFINSTEILAEDTETTELVAPSSNDSRENVSNVKTEIIEAHAMEAIWFGFDEEVAIATRHETPISKAPSIVTVITAEEIKRTTSHSKLLMA